MVPSAGDTVEARGPWADGGAGAHGSGERGATAGRGAARGPGRPSAALAGAPLLAALAGCSAAGDAFAKRTGPVGRALSAPVSTMLCGAVLANAVPALGGNSVDLAELRAVQGVLVAVATPLLLMGANLRTIFEGAGPLVPGFAVGAFGTLAGTLLGVAVLGDGLTDALGALAGIAEGSPVGGGMTQEAEVAGMSAALAAKNIGGGFNFVAVCESSGVSSPVVALALAADNIAALLYFPLNSFLAGPPIKEGQTEGGGEDGEGSAWTPPPMRIADYGSAEELTLALAVSLAIVVAVASAGAGGNTIAAASAATILLATASPRNFEPLRVPGSTLARVLLGLFFASAGLAGGSVVGIDSGALLYVGALLVVIYATHIAAVTVARSLFGMTALEAAVVSNAAVGGPATAAALAAAKGTDPTPAVLLGNLGNAAATFLALAALPLLRVAAHAG